MATREPGVLARPTGACVRCRHIKTKCMYEASQTKCRACLRGGYDCVFVSKAERMAEKRRRAREFASRGEQRPTSQTPPETSQATLPPPPQQKLSSEEDVDELPPELLSHCHELLQNCIWPFSAFHWPTFRKKLAAGTVEKSLYYATLASAVRGSRKVIAHFGSPVAASDFFARIGRRYVLDNLDHPSLADVQALLLIIVLDWGSCRSTQAFMYLGMAARMAITFLPEADHRLANDFLAAEAARRTIWMVFMVEQFLSSGNGRIPTIQELPISLPCSETNFLFGIPTVVPTFDGGLPPRRPAQDNLGTVGEFGSMVQVSRIWSLVATWKFKCRPEDPVEPQLTQLEDALSNWKDSLPPQYQDMPDHLQLHISMGTGLAFGFVYCVYHCAVVSLHRERLYMYRRETNLSASDSRVRDKAIETIFSSAERIIEIINTLEASGTEDYITILPKFMLYACFTASSAIAYISIEKLTESRQASFKIVRESLRILQSMRHTWPLLEGWYSLLSSMVKVLQDRAMGIDSTAPRDLPFETLPHGHMRVQTSATSIGATTSAVATMATGGIVSSGAPDTSLSPNYFDKLSPGSRDNLFQYLDNQNDLSILLG